MQPRTALAFVAAAALAACASAPGGGGSHRTATLQRTTFGVAHIAAPDLETLAYGVAYAHTEDNVCQTAQALVTVRGERSRWFGAGSGLLGLRLLPNEQIDFFIAAHMDDAALDRAWAGASAEAQGMARAWVEGHNRWLADNAARVPAACKGQPWMRPMTLAEYRRLNELSMVQAGVAALADAVLAAKPPAPTAAAPAPVTLAEAAEAFRETGVTDPAIGSNAWAFGKDSTANGRGVLLGNPHFPWVGVNRFWQMHLTVPGRLDVMGASIGTTAVVQIGFNKDVAWSHTVSTGKRFTLHELKLAAGDPTSYLVDGKPEKMGSRTLKIQVKSADGSLAEKTQALWTSRFGPVLVMPRAGLNWTAANAYAVQDVNAGNTRGTDTWLGFAAARSVNDMVQAMGNLGIPWVNTIATDRDGRALYADVSNVPDVDQEQLNRCAPSRAAAGLFGGAGIAVLDGSRSDCNWRRDSHSPVPGVTPIERMPIIMRSDWVQNSNDSFFWTNPAVKLDNISPMVGDALIRRPRTRAGLTEIPEMLARGKVSPRAVQEELFANRSVIARYVLPDLLAACPQAPSAETRDGCAALRQWDGTANLDARGAHLFTEFWRTAGGIAGVHRQPFDAARRAATPAGLKMDDAAVAAKVWDALAGAVKKVRDAGFALDAPLWSIQVMKSPAGPVAIHGGDEHIGVLNKISALATNGIGPNGQVPDHGTSYVQTVTFDERGPVAQALLTYGQSPERDSPHAFDQMRLYARKQWPTLPFHAEDVERERVGAVTSLRRP